MAAAKEMSLDAAITAVLSVKDVIFLKDKVDNIFLLHSRLTLARLATTQQLT